MRPPLCETRIPGLMSNSAQFLSFLVVYIFFFVGPLASGSITTSLQMLRLVVALSVLLGAHAAAKLLRVSSTSADPSVAATTGDYIADGEAFGFPRYRLDSAVATRILYRSPKRGVWVITGSETTVVKNEGPVVVSITSAASPQGLAFKYLFEGTWILDESFAVTDVKNRLLSQARIESSKLY